MQDNAQVFTASDIQFYKTLPGDPDQETEKGLIEHRDAIELVDQHMLKKGVQMTADFDNVEYQQYVLSLGTAFDEFNAEDMKKILDLVKFIDLYENYTKNDQLNEYKNLLNQRVQLSKDQTDELALLLPVFNAPTTAGNEAPDSAKALENATDISLTAASNGYDNIATRDYAYEWWDGRNPVYSTYYAEKAGCDVTDKKCWTKWNDCANFVSQSLRAGGMNFQYGAHYTSNASWFFGPLVPSYTWGVRINSICIGEEEPGLLKVLPTYKLVML